MKSGCEIWVSEMLTEDEIFDAIFEMPYSDEPSGILFGNVVEAVLKRGPLTDSDLMEIASGVAGASDLLTPATVRACVFETTGRLPSGIRSCVENILKRGLDGEVA